MTHFAAGTGPLPWHPLLLVFLLLARRLYPAVILIQLVALGLFWESVARLQPPPSSRCVQCGVAIRSRRPRCAACTLRA